MNALEQQQAAAASDGPVDEGRRKALKLGGLAVAFLWLGSSGRSLAALDAAGAASPGVGDTEGAAFAPNAFVRVDSDGKVRLVMPNVEMGQAIYTGTAMLLAEELGVDLGQVEVEHSPSNAELYGTKLLGGEQATGGSTSTRNSWQSLREAGAIARTMLVAAAARQWKVDPASCTVEHGEVVHAASGRRLGYGKLAAAAAKLPPPAKVKLKDAGDFRIIGKRWRRVDARIKGDGTAQFGLDVRVPGMKIATIKACPVFGGKLASVDEAPAMKVPGVLKVVRLDNAVAVIGEHFWAAKQGLDALDIQWDRGANAGLDTDALWRALDERSRHGQPVTGRKVGEPSGQGKRIEAVYQLPLLAHAPMEPLNATVHVTPDKCSVWMGSQVPNRVVATAARLTGLPQDKIEFTNHYRGGGFGRRLEIDVVEQAVNVAKQVDYPVKLVWTREEDVRHDIPRPMYFDRIAATVGEDGLPTYWHHRTTGPSVLKRWMPKAFNGMDSDLVECAAEPPYELPNLLSEWVPFEMPQGLVIGWWRGVGPTHNLYVVESFVDELAHAAGKDPLAYRRSLLKNNPRSLAVLNLAAEKIGWGQGTLPPRVGRGIALGEPFGSRVCTIVETEVSAQGEVKLRRVVIALDCGTAVNPSSVEAQAQGGVIFGLSAALYSGLHIKDGGIVESNFNDYRNIRINEIPAVEVYRIESHGPPGGLGEVGTAIAAPALNNAIFAATGVRLRRLPIDNAALAQGQDALKAPVASVLAGGTAEETRS